jgi:hypothetical protein
MMQLLAGQLGRWLVCASCADFSRNAVSYLVEAFSFVNNTDFAYNNAPTKT